MKYVVKSGSATGHCCFEASVVDSTVTSPHDNSVVCECYDPAMAERIASLLNGSEPQHDYSGDKK